MLAQAVGPNLTKLLHDQLDLMFGCGLSEPLRQALVAIATHIPPLLKTIQGMNAPITCVNMVLKPPMYRQAIGPVVNDPQRTQL